MPRRTPPAPCKNKKDVQENGNVKCVRDCPNGKEADGQQICKKCPPGKARIVPRDSPSRRMKMEMTKFEGNVSDLFENKTEEIVDPDPVDPDKCAKCAVGKYQDKHGAEMCELCPEGSYSNEVGSVNCIPCPPGYHNDKTGQRECVKCGVNMTASRDIEGAVHCDNKCEKGTYWNGQSNFCVFVVGLLLLLSYLFLSLSLSSNIGESCIQASQGHMVDKPTMKKQIICKAGTYQDRIGQAKCIGKASTDA